MAQTDEQRRQRVMYHHFRRIGEALVDPEGSPAKTLDVIDSVMNNMSAYRYNRIAESAADSIALVKQDLGLA